MTTKQVYIFRKSLNTNSFGLRGYWLVEAAPEAGQHRVFSFASSADPQKGPQSFPFVAHRQDVNGVPLSIERPVAELVQLQGFVASDKLQAMLERFGVANEVPA